MHHVDRIIITAASVVGVCAVCGGHGAEPRRPRAPFKVLYSNDTTHITSCVSPYHGKGEHITDDMLRASVDEAAGADVHMLQPGMGWIPWWKSKIYPGDAHYRWYEREYGVKPNSYGRYMIGGGDLVRTFVTHCRAKGVTPFVSLRLNDGHGLEHAGTGHRMAMHCVSRFYIEHPEYRIGRDKRDWNQHVHNWAVPEVREHKFGFIRELCDNYDLDGFELDFMRHVSYFQVDRTTSEQRRGIMTRFVGRVRKLLDRTAREGRRHWLCVRVPAQLAAHDALGIDLPEMVETGVDMVNLSGYYFTVQQTDLPAIRKSIRDAAVYLEMTHCTATGPSLGGYDSFSYRRTTREQFSTTAHLAYTQGADGVSLFNFMYYREHGTPGRGPFNEPPFDVLAELGHPDRLARGPQWYVLGDAWNQPQLKSRPLPAAFKAGQIRKLSLELAPTADQTKDGVLRMMTKQDSSKCRWQVRLNGTELRRTDFVDKPIDHGYDAGRGQANQYACFVCPRSAVRKGTNRVAITLEQGGPATVRYLDLVLP